MYAALTTPIELIENSLFSADWLSSPLLCRIISIFFARSKLPEDDIGN